MGSYSIIGDGNHDNIVGHDNFISESFQKMTGTQQQEALELAHAGTREYNLIKHLNIDPGAILGAPAEVVRNVSAISWCRDRGTARSWSGAQGSDNSAGPSFSWLHEVGTRSA
jgi:hypothetical protein